MQLDLHDPLIAKMQAQIAAWEHARDNRAIFLTCYAMMTQNMRRAIPAGEFRNGPWVNLLLERFADYYFDALNNYDQAQQPPQVWQSAFAAAQQPKRHVMQHLLLGVNAHINYDLVFVLVELLQADWKRLKPDDIQTYYADHCHVNEVIFRTINAVQEEVIERYSRWMGVVDVVMGGLDEQLLGQMIQRWREEVWESAAAMLRSDTKDQTRIRLEVASRGEQRANAILLQHGLSGLRALW